MDPCYIIFYPQMLETLALQENTEENPELRSEKVSCDLYKLHIMTSGQMDSPPS